MKLLLDACVLYPTVMREMLIGAAEAGFFTPVWSPRIMEEWARAARKLGAEGEAQARAEIALLDARHPKSSIKAPEALETRLWLPDSADIHVLAAAIASSSDGIVTLNAKDFPKNILLEEGLERIDPDRFLLECFGKDADAMSKLGDKVVSEAIRLSGQDWTIRSLMKKARLPRLGKALESYGLV